MYGADGQLLNSQSRGVIWCGYTDAMGASRKILSRVQVGLSIFRTCDCRCTRGAASGAEGRSELSAKPEEPLGTQHAIQQQDNHATTFLVLCAVNWRREYGMLPTIEAAPGGLSLF